MSYLRATKNNTQYRISIGNKDNKHTGFFPSIKTHNTADGNFSGLLSNVKLFAGRTYYVKVKFRTRGDGNSTSSKCSSVGFIAYWDSWAKSRSYIHNSSTAYSEIGQIVEWTYSFTVDSDVTPTGTALYFIINNGWANGNDAQTIDLFYLKYWDSRGNVYNEKGALEKNLVQKWGGTDYSVDSLVAINGNKFLYIDVPQLKGVVTDEYYTIDFDAYTLSSYSGTEFYVTVRLKGNESVKIVNTTVDDDVEIGTIFKHYSVTFLLPKNMVETYYPQILVGTMYHDMWVKNFKLRKGSLQCPMFLKSKQGSFTYYSLLYTKGAVKVTENNETYYLRESASLYKYSELTAYTYGLLTGKFAV